MLKGDGESQEAQANVVASSSSAALPSQEMFEHIPKNEVYTFLFLLCNFHTCIILMYLISDARKYKKMEK